MASFNALLSLSDREGLDRLAPALRSRGYRLFATSGTAAAIRALGIECEDVADLTGFPPLCDGRVKTLHPKIFAGILAERANPQHVADLEKFDVPAFSVVAVTLYPFETVVARAGTTIDDAVENIDIGGVALIRAAAKNFADVSVLTDPAQYADLIGALERGGPTLDERHEWARVAFARCETYDAAIADYLEHPDAIDRELPDRLRLTLPLAMRLRYGENPWARAAFYLGGGTAPFPRQLAGKMLSYNNLLDVDSCLRLLSPVDEPLGFPEAGRSERSVHAAIVKHTVPCGYAARTTALEALERALGADPISAYGGIVACDAPIDESAAALLGKRFLEVVAAPAFDAGALERLAAKKNLRVLQFDASLPARLLAQPKVRSALGGLLMEFPDEAAPHDAWRLVAGPQPAAAQWRDLLFAFGAVRQVKSNAAVVVKDEVTLGVCGGQTNRVAAVELACRRAGKAVRGAALATDGYFPFTDGVEAAAAAGITAVVAPSGSIRDPEVVAAAERLGLSLVFAARRYFLH
ncbi:MAG TPA: bifunctional phosphoribosylaminoimidazolecarboxamide formyltransferase/IMP cyclohydrolase [Candidatus Eremiobacteraceae bacterium]|nr:bifunctional phosphoribosylaminoimidazolecarboxamide formyltransferase/IMP cyclohydrolase [Candidatus Eremiobacteraceae bacterium]